MKHKETQQSPEYKKERNDALRSLDREQITRFLEKYGKIIPDNDLLFWAGVHKTRLKIEEMSENEKEASRNWLRKNGFLEGIYY